MTQQYKVVTREQWLAARLELLEREKELTRAGDELARRRRALPWVRIEKDYTFETDAGTRTLSELFDGRSRLLVYHFMFGRDWPEGCPGCTLSADHFDGAIAHLARRDVTMICASRAPLERLQAYKRRMGWRFGWVSTLGSFNLDFGVSFSDGQRRDGGRYNYRWLDQPSDELPGLSAFALEGGIVYHTYSSYARGNEFLDGVRGLLDRAPRGRDEGDRHRLDFKCTSSCTMTRTAETTA
ncbi:MAG: DUF899 domain-containing protein [Solirubrobacterales bacterium]|nr:DUF899 domain-containing protein [Solirubrobacterales bacterium]